MPSWAAVSYLHRHGWAAHRRTCTPNANPLLRHRVTDISVARFGPACISDIVGFTTISSKISEEKVDAVDCSIITIIICSSIGLMLLP